MTKDNCSYKILLYSILSMLFATFVHFAVQYFYDDYLLEERSEKLLQVSESNYINKQLDEFYIPLSIQLDRSKRLFYNAPKNQDNFSKDLIS